MQQKTGREDCENALGGLPHEQECLGYEIGWDILSLLAKKNYLWTLRAGSSEGVLQ
jgi:hypothetical protein